MQRDARPTFDGSHDFLTYGAIGLELDRAQERRALEMSAGTWSFPGRAKSAARKRLGAWLVGLGEHLAGEPTPAPVAR